jgi:tetratricopeptide (TPR) repeat protein
MRLRLPFVDSPRPLHPLRGLRAQEPAAANAESRLGELIRRMEEPPLLDAGAHDAILRRLQHSRGNVRPKLVLPARPALVVAIALAVLFLGIAAHAAISWVRRVGLPWAHHGAPVAARLPDARAPASPAAVHSAPTSAIPPASAGVGPEAPALSPPAPQKLRIRAGGSAAKTTSSARAIEPPPSSLGQESRLLGAALAALRTNRDYAGALATLGEYDARFPNGALRGEAAVARLDALMALGQSAAALRLLDGRGQGQAPWTTGPRAAEVLVLRGELRAGAGRYQEAIEDFDRAAALAGNRQLPQLQQLRERALYGRLSCRARSGDAAGSSRDVQEYLSKFPDGPRAAELRQRKPGP